MAHPSTLKWEQHLSGRTTLELQSHLSACESCRSKVADMERASAKYASSGSRSRARAAAVHADRRWKRRAAVLTLLPALAAAALFFMPGSPPVARRQARELLEPRGGATSTRLRSLPLRGRNVDFGQGALEAASNDGAARPFTLTHTKVDISVTGFMQSVTVTQTFNNPFTTPVEAVYVFPLPDDAAVHDLELKAGSRVLRAAIQKRADARAMYETAKAEGRRAALLDQERPNIFTQSLANLLPGETVKVTISYVAPLRFDDGVYTLNFPMVVGPRYVPGAKLEGEAQGTGTSVDTDVVPDASRISPPVARSGRDIEVHVRVDAGTVIEELWSVSHRLEVDRTTSARVDVDLHPLDTLPNKDLILRWRVSGPQARAVMLAGGGSFALMLNPEARQVNAPVTPRELVFVIDTSCSMSGEPLDAARRAMGQAMDALQPTDTFMLIDFASTASSFHPEPLVGTPDNVRRAKAYLQGLPAAGGTNQLDGIRAALARPLEEGRLRLVLLMTDGYIGNEDEILAETRRLRGDARLFGFGVGSSVNHFLLSRLSEEGRGFYSYVRTDEDPGEAVTRFVRRIERPLIRDVVVDWGGLEVSDVFPNPVADLFDAQPLIVQGRYRKAGAGTVVLRGARGGLPVVFEVPVTLPALESEGRALQMAWARAQVERLSRGRYGDEDAQTISAITALGLEHRLVTKYTSLVAVDEQRVTGDAGTTVMEPTLVPDQPAVVDSGERASSQKRFNIIQVIRGGGGPVNGSGVKVSLSQSDIMETIFAHKTQLAACAAKQLAVQPELHGELVLRWWTRADGTVERVAVESAEFASTEFASCVTTLVKTFQFAAASRASSTTFPFKF